MSCCSPSPSTSVAGTAASPFVLKQGRTFNLVTTAKAENNDGELREVDLSSPARTGRAQLRRQIQDLGDPIATLTVTIRSPQTGSNRGKADVRLSAVTSAAPQIDPGLYVLDVEFVNDSDATDVLSSDVFYVRVDPEVTK